MRATTTKILQNSMYDQECNMVFIDSALMDGLVVDSPWLTVCVSVSLHHLLSHVTCHMSPITCNVSHDLFYNICLLLKKNYNFFFYKWDKVVELVGGGSVINMT